MSYFVYRIDCEQEVIYIGETCELPYRIGRHFSGKGSSATIKYKPISWKIICVCPTEKAAKEKEQDEVSRLRLLGFTVWGGSKTSVGYISEKSPNHPKNKASIRAGIIPEGLWDIDSE